MTKDEFLKQTQGIRKRQFAIVAKIKVIRSFPPEFNENTKELLDQYLIGEATLETERYHQAIMSKS